jgi:hypothetical protein
MTATVTVQPNGFSVQYSKTQWRVIYVEHSSGKFYFRLSSQDFWFEPRDRYRYPSHDDAKRAAHCFLELMKRKRAIAYETECLGRDWNSQVSPTSVPLV